MRITQNKAMSVLDRKIKSVFALDGRMTPERELMSSIVILAILDLYSPPRRTKKEEKRTQADRISALQYLTGDIIHAEACGIGSEYIRILMRGFGLDINKCKIMGGNVFSPIDKTKWELKK